MRDRQDRLLTLFTKPNPDRVAQAQRIVAEGARFNLNPADIRLNRTINLPLTAVRFLRTVDQYRSHFNIPPQNRSTDVVSLEFTEEHRPRLITTPDQAAATGRFDIELATGRVLSSTLNLRSRSANATIEVKFGPHPQIGMYLPREHDRTVPRLVQRDRHRHRNLLAVPPVQSRDLGRSLSADRPVTRVSQASSVTFR